MAKWIKMAKSSELQVNQVKSLPPLALLLTQVSGYPSRAHCGCKREGGLRAIPPNAPAFLNRARLP